LGSATKRRKYPEHYGAHLGRPIRHGMLKTSTPTQAVFLTRTVPPAPDHLPTTASSRSIRRQRQRSNGAPTTGEAGTARPDHAVQSEEQAGHHAVQRAGYSGQGLELEPGRAPGFAAAPAGRDDPRGAEEDGGQDGGGEGGPVKLRRREIMRWSKFTGQIIQREFATLLV
jgi:hypothetical protein